MSTDDFAIYQAMPLGRDEVFERVMAVLTRHQVRFLNMARGARFDPPLGFSYVLDQDLEDLDSPREALIASHGWQRVIMDFSHKELGFELHLFGGQPPHERMEVVAIRYSEHDTNLARTDPGRADRLLTLLQDLGVALDRSAMLCGSKLESQAYSAAELEKTFASHIAAPVDRADNAIHSALFQSEAFALFAGAPGAGAFRRQIVEPGYVMATLLLPP
jgi:hypothetical protein